MMPKKSFKQSRRAEVEFKLALVKAAIKEEKYQQAGTLKDHRWLHMDYDFLANLDPSEKGAISYWIGMVFATLIAQKKYSYEYLC